MSEVTSIHWRQVDRYRYFHVVVLVRTDLCTVWQVHRYRYLHVSVLVRSDLGTVWQVHRYRYLHVSVLVRSDLCTVWQVHSASGMEGSVDVLKRVQRTFSSTFGYKLEVKCDRR